MKSSQGRLQQSNSHFIRLRNSLEELAGKTTVINYIQQSFT